MGADRSQRIARRILALAEEEHELVLSGREDELAALDERRTAALAELPDELSDAARSTLLHALGVQHQVTAALRDGLAAVGSELALVRRGRSAAVGYSPAGVDPRRVLDRMA